MPSLDEVITFRQQIHAQSMELIKRKGHDYNRTQQNSGDTLFNLRVCELLGIVPTAERGILVRLSDKFMRLISLIDPGVKPSVNNESVIDTVVDIHNYVDYLLLMHLRRVGVGQDVVAYQGEAAPQAGAYRGADTMDKGAQMRIESANRRG